MSASSAFKSISSNSSSSSSTSNQSTEALVSFPTSSVGSFAQSSEATSLQSAGTLVWSNFGLSAFDYPLNRENRNKVQSHLNDLTFDIVAVWVVARPLTGKKHTKLKVNINEVNEQNDRTIHVIHSTELFVLFVICI